jgi:ankyrin repeat protein
VLLKAGASVKLKDNGGNTALHYSAAKKNKNCMELLIEAGGRLDLKNSAGQTPLDVTSESFASLFELQRVAQTKLKEHSIEKVSQIKSLMKKNLNDAVETKSTHMESANTITKSLFSSKTVPLN